MRALRALAWRVAGLLGFGRPDREIAEELLTHREMLAAEYRRSGMDEEAARQAAAVACGSLTAAESAYRDRRGLPVLENLARDCRFAFRSLRRTPGVFASMIAVLGLGVGFNTAVATVIHTVAWQSLPVPDPHRVVRLAPTYAGGFPHQILGGEARFSYADFVDYRETSHTLESLAVMSHERVTWRREADTRTLAAAWVSADYFPTMGVVAEAGRTLAHADARRPVAVISHRLWMEAFDGKPDAIGRTLSLDRSLYSVVGIAPESFAGTEVQPVDVWLPLEAAATLEGVGDRLRDRRVIWLQAIGRLSPGTPLAAARAEAAVIAGQLDSRVQDRRTAVLIARASRLDTTGLLQSHDAPVVLGAGVIAAGLMATLLLICGSNGATLLLARGAGRQQEIALRMALGAGRGRLAQQFLAEILVVATITTLVGAAVSVASLRLLSARVPAQDILPAAAMPDLRIFGFSALFAAAVTFIFGLAPLRQALNVDCLANITGGVSAWGGRVTAARLRTAFVATQVAVSVVLLVGAALLARGVGRSLRVDVGYVTSNLFIVRPDVGDQSSQPGRATTAASRMRELMAATPGVEAVGLTEIAPFMGAATGSLSRDGVESVPVHFNRIDEHYFEALGIGAIAGRVFQSGDTDVAIVNARLARLFWGSPGAAVGQTLDIADVGFTATRRMVQIVGVVPALQTTHPGTPDEPTYYTPLTKVASGPASLLVRARPGVNVSQAAARAARSLDPDAVVTATPVDERLNALTMPARIGAVTAGLIGLLALLVASVGIHGIVAHAVTARIREIGVRVALGAAPTGIIRLVLAWTMRGVAIGLLAGLAIIAIAVTAFSAELRATLFGLDPLDPAAFSVAVSVLVGVTLLAAYLPARRALGIGPLAALRHD
jgi:predicted permease